MCDLAEQLPVQLAYFPVGLSLPTTPDNFRNCNSVPVLLVVAQGVRTKWRGMVASNTRAVGKLSIHQNSEHCSVPYDSRQASISHGLGSASLAFGCLFSVLGSASSGCSH